MQGWMIALIAVAALIALVAILFISGALVFVHAILGRRKELSEKTKLKKGYTKEKFGVDTDWFKTVLSTTSQASITAYDGVKLGARIIRQNEPTGRVAVCCHGYGATFDSTQVQVKMFYDRGFDVYMLAMRGHKGSGGKVGMAWIDRFDLSRWIDRIIADYGQSVQIALYGISMGGATVISYSGMNPPPQVKCVVNDCGFNSQLDEYTACLKAAHLPKCSIHLFNVGLKLVHGYSLYDADITKFAKDMIIPALFFHGTADDFVPFELGQKLYDACASAQKSFIAVEGAGHGCAYVKDKQRYAEAFADFIDKNVEGSTLVHTPEEYARSAETVADDSPTTEENTSPDEQPVPPTAPLND